MADKNSRSALYASTKRRRSRTSAREIKRLQRREKVYNWRLEGHSIRYIAKHLQMGAGTVQRDIDAAMAAARDKLADRAQSELLLSLERLDRYQAVLHERTEKGDQAAIETCLRIENQRARLLQPDGGRPSAGHPSVNVNILNAQEHGIAVAFQDPTRKFDTDGNPINRALPPPDMNGPRPMNQSEHTDERFPYRLDHDPNEPARPKPNPAARYTPPPPEPPPAPRTAKERKAALQERAAAEGWPVQNPGPSAFSRVFNPNRPSKNGKFY